MALRHMQCILDYPNFDYPNFKLMIFIDESRTFPPVRETIFGGKAARHVATDSLRSRVEERQFSPELGDETSGTKTGMNTEI